MTTPLLQVEQLSVGFVGARWAEGPMTAVAEAGLELHAGELLGLVGESGCGKSTLARGLLRLLPPPAVITGGRVLLEGRDLLAMDDAALRQVRWRQISLVFQGALDALNPVRTVEAQLVDVLEAHGAARGQQARAKAATLLSEVALPGEVLSRHPHELSGGMRQRVVIAMALALEPQVLLMDEPTTSLDVVVQASIMDVVDRLRRERSLGVLLVSHDLPLVLERCDRVAVMYAGRIVESGPVERLRSRPAHPYTARLLASHPRLDGPREIPPALPGRPPDLAHLPRGCRFHPRCDVALERCRTEEPPLVTLGGTGGEVACHRVESASVVAEVAP